VPEKLTVELVDVVGDLVVFVRVRARSNMSIKLITSIRPTKVDVVQWHGR